MSETYVPMPFIDVQANALKNGFDRRVEFPIQNIVKYYKVVDLTKLDFWEEGVSSWYASRACAQEGGLLASPYNLDMAKVLYDSLSLDLDEQGMAIGGKVREAIDASATSGDGTAAVYDSGRAVGNCGHQSITGSGGKWGYNAQNGKLWPLGQISEEGFTKTVCEFQGSANLVIQNGAKMEATNRNNAQMGIENAFDNDWGLVNKSTAGAWTFASNDAKCLILITFPNEIGVLKVTLLPQLNKNVQRLKNPRVLVSNTPPGKSSCPSPDKSLKFSCRCGLK